MSQPLYHVDIVGFARQQLAEIEDYIVGQEAPVEAYDFVWRLTEFCYELGLFPRKHLERDDIRKDLHIVGFEGSTTIAYHVNDTTRVVSVLGIFYGGQNWEAALRSMKFERF